MSNIHGARPEARS